MRRAPRPRARDRGGARRRRGTRARRPGDRDGGRGPGPLQSASRSGGRDRLAPDGRRRGPHPRPLVGDRPGPQRPPRALGLQRVQPQRPALQLGQPRQRGQDGARHGHARDAHHHRPGADLDEQRAEQAQPALEAVDEGLRRVLTRRRGALQGPGRPLPDLERAQPAGLAAAAVGLRQPAAQLQAGLAARLPRARARGRAADPGGRPGRRDRRGRAGADRQQPDQRQHADQAAAVPARDGVRRRALPHASRAVPAAASRPRRRTPSATTRTRCCWRRTSPIRTPTRRSSPTSSGCSPCSTGCAASAACGSGRPST